jgi:hypothetical protein
MYTEIIHSHCCWLKKIHDSKAFTVLTFDVLEQNAILEVAPEDRISYQICSFNKIKLFYIFLQNQIHRYRSIHTEIRHYENSVADNSLVITRLGLRTLHDVCVPPLFRLCVICGTIY